MFQGIKSITTPFLGRKVGGKLLSPLLISLSSLRGAQATRQSSYRFLDCFASFAMTHVGFARTQ